LLAEKTGMLDEMDERAMTVMDFLEPLHVEGRLSHREGPVARC
jgi:hypothetical protein